MSEIKFEAALAAFRQMTLVESNSQNRNDVILLRAAIQQHIGNRRIQLENRRRARSVTLLPPFMAPITGPPPVNPPVLARQ